MKNLTVLFFIIISTIALTRNAWKNHPEIDSLTKDSANQRTNLATAPDFATPIDNLGNYISGALSREQVGQLAAAGIEMIIRLNGDTQSDRGPMSIAEEAQVCEENGIFFRYINIEGDLQESGRRITRMLSDGNTLIHCRHGKHRAPAMAGYYLQEKWRIQRPEIINRVGWEKLIKNPGQYRRYTNLIAITGIHPNG